MTTIRSEVGANPKVSGKGRAAAPTARFTALSSLTDLQKAGPAEIAAILENTSTKAFLYIDGKADIEHHVKMRPLIDMSPVEFNTAMLEVEKATPGATRDSPRRPSEKLEKVGPECLRAGR